MSASTGDDAVETSARPDGDCLSAGDAALLARDTIVLVSALIYIALLIALMLGLAVSDSHDSQWWLVPAILASVYFYSSFLSSFMVFQSNAAYLMKLSRSEPPGDGQQLQTLRHEASDALALGVIFAIFMAIVAALSR